jgi:hypothetical protein
MKTGLIVVACGIFLCACSREVVCPTTDENGKGSALSSCSTTEAMTLSRARFPGLQFQLQDAGEIGRVQCAALQTNGVHVAINIYEAPLPEQPFRALKLYLTNKNSEQEAEEILRQIVQPFATRLFDNGGERWRQLQDAEVIEDILHLDLETHGISLTVRGTSNRWETISYDLITAAEQESMRKRYFK